MKRWISLIFLLSIPAVVLAGSLTDKTQEDVENQVIGSIYQLYMLVWQSDFFDWDDYILAGSSLINKALERYPESIRLHEQLQDLTIRKLADPRLDIDKESVHDSLVSHYRELYEANPKSAPYAYLYVRASRDEELGLEIADKVGKKRKKSYWMHYVRGMSLMEMEHFDEAEEALKKAVEIEPDLYDAHHDLAMLYFFTRQPQPLVDEAIRTVELAPHPSICSGVYVRAQRLGAGIENKEKLVELERVMFKKLSSSDEELLSSMARKAESSYSAFRTAGEIDSAWKYLDYAEAYAAPLDDWSLVSVKLNRAAFHASQSNSDAAFEILGLLADNGYTEYGYLADDEDLGQLAEDTRMVEIVNRVKENARHELLSGLTAEPAPDFTLITTDGVEVTLSELKGKPVILDFWGIGCGPCYQLMPVLERFYQDYGEDVVIYGIESWHNTAEDIVATAAKLNVTYPHLVGSTEVSQAYGVTGVPHMVVIDSDGNIVYIHHGFAPGKGVAGQMYDELEWLYELLSE